VGYLPFVPGTWGSLLGLLLTWFFVPVNWWAVLIWLLILIIGAVVSTTAEKDLGHDARPIVIDEILGMGLALLLVPKRIVYYVIAFILFRFFDIVKPFPARQAEKLPGGWGVMADDLVAGVYANVVVQILVRLTYVKL
jgi:phosphatidylglycerophosphatase A